MARSFCSHIACSRHSDSGEWCEVKGSAKNKSQEGGEVREGRTSFPSPPLLFIVSSLRTPLHYLNAWNRLVPRPPHPLSGNVYCNLQITALVTTFFSACGGILRCRAKAGRLKHGKFMNSPRSQFFCVVTQRYSERGTLRYEA